MSCSVCEASRRALLCPDCFEATCTGRRSDRRGLQEQRDAVLQQLTALVEGKEARQRQQLQLLQLSEELRHTRQRAAEAERAALAVRQRAAEARASLHQHRLRLGEAEQQLGQLARQLEASAPVLRSKQAACWHRQEELSREQRIRVVRRLMQFLPITLVPPACPASPSDADGSAADAAAAQQTQQAAAGGERAAAMICSLPLPDSRASMAEVATLSASLGSALGYLALLLDVLGRSLRLPVAQRCAFRGSASRLWQPDGFFDMRAGPPNDALPLSWPRADEWGGGLGSSVGSSLGMGGGGAAAAQAQARREAQLQSALTALQRCAGTLVYARLGPEAALKVPPDWPPFAWLAGLCKVLGAEPRATSARVPVPGATAAAGGPRGLAASAVFGRYSRAEGGMAHSVVLFQDSGTEEGEEDWEHLPRPAYGMIPPPPSQPEDVEHWVQAHADNSSSATASVAAATFGTSPLARLRALTRAYLGSPASLGS